MQRAGKCEFNEREGVARDLCNCSLESAAFQQEANPFVCFKFVYTSFACVMLHTTTSLLAHKDAASSDDRLGILTSCRQQLVTSRRA